MQASAVENEPESEREVTITRVYDAPARLLFEAYSKPEHIKKWFGPKGWPVTLCEMDFRVGGSFRFAMTGPSGKQNTPFGGEYREIVPDRKIVYDNGFETKGAGRMLVTVTFDEGKDGKTTLTIHTLFQSIAMRNSHVSRGFEQGTNSGLDQLGDARGGDGDRASGHKKRSRAGLPLAIRLVSSGPSAARRLPPLEGATERAVGGAAATPATVVAVAS